MRAGRPDEALERLEQATELDPLERRLRERARRALQRSRTAWTSSSRSSRSAAIASPIAASARTSAARPPTSREALQDKELARELWLKLLEDGDDREALERLVDDAVEREDHTEAATLLRRLGQNTVDKAEKARVALREAELLAEGVGDVDTAISRYERILSELDSDVPSRTPGDRGPAGGARTASPRPPTRSSAS